MSPKLLAVIEVGSRAVRLLVAARSGSSLTPIITRSYETRMMGRLAGGPVEVELLLQELRGKIEEYEALARQRGAGSVDLIGTEAARRLVETVSIVEDPTLSRLRILSPEEEARCSAIAAISASTQRVRGSVLVIDQGGGSVEIIEAEVGEHVRTTRFESLKLGADTLFARLLASRGDLRLLKNEVAYEIDMEIGKASFEIAFGLGSAATKCGWLFSEPPAGSRYSAQRAHGRHVTIQQLRALAEIFMQTPYPRWEEWRERFDPANPKSDDLERVVTGAILLLLLLERHELATLTVSTMGTRHGFLLAANGDKY